MKTENDPVASGVDLVLHVQKVATKQLSGQLYQGGQSITLVAGCVSIAEVEGFKIARVIDGTTGADL